VVLYDRPKVFKFLDGKPTVFKISTGRLRKQPFSNGSDIRIPYISMNTMANGRDSNPTIVDQEGSLLAMATILAN